MKKFWSNLASTKGTQNIIEKARDENTSYEKIISLNAKEESLPSAERRKGTLAPTPNQEVIFPLLPTCKRKIRLL